MTDKKTLLKQLDEYDVALQRLRQDGHRWDGNSTAQLSYLERRVLELQTQLSILELRVQPVTENSGSFLARLNLWHPDFHLWSYIAALVIFMVIAFAVHIVLGPT